MHFKLCVHHHKSCQIVSRLVEIQYDYDTGLEFLHSEHDSNACIHKRILFICLNNNHRSLTAIGWDRPTFSHFYFKLFF